MPDWTEIVKTQLGALGLAPEREAEIVDEVAAHLEELCDDFRRRGWSEEDSVKEAIASVSDWYETGQRIRFAEEGEGTMNQSIRSFWLPGLCAVAMFYLTLRLSGFISMSAMAYTANLNSVAVVAGATYLLGALGAGAGAAFLSRRMGGGLRHQALGAVLPAGMWIVLAVVSLVSLPLVRVAHPQMKFHLLPLAVLLITVIIALPLVFGALLVILQSRWSNRLRPDS